MTDDRFEQELAANRKAYSQLRDEIRRQYSGKYIGMAYGKIMAVDNNYDVVTAAMDALDPAPACSLVFPADDEPLFDPPCTEHRYEFQ
jgi:hypothetical protein